MRDRTSAMLGGAEPLFHLVKLSFCAVPLLVCCSCSLADGLKGSLGLHRFAVRGSFEV